MSKPNPPPSLLYPRPTPRELGDVHEAESTAYAIFFVLAFGYSSYNISPDSKEVESGPLNFSSETELFVHVSESLLIHPEVYVQYRKCCVQYSAEKRLTALDAFILAHT